MLLIIPLIAGSVFLPACDEDVGGTVHVRRSAYVGDYDDADFYYVRSRPYSHYYGPLYLRDGRYFYSRGGAYYRYEPTRVVRRTVVRRDVDDDDDRVVVRRRVVHDDGRQVTVTRRVIDDD